MSGTEGTHMGYPDTYSRNRAARDIEGIGRRLTANASRVRLYGDVEADAEWPPAEPVPPEVSAAIQAAADAVHALDVAITKARLDYRKRVLEWLLAEAERVA